MTVKVVKLSCWIVSGTSVPNMVLFWKSDIAVSAQIQTKTGCGGKKKNWSDIEVYNPKLLMKKGTDYTC